MVLKFSQWDCELPEVQHCVSFTFVFLASFLGCILWNGAVVCITVTCKYWLPRRRIPCNFLPWMCFHRVVVYAGKLQSDHLVWSVHLQIRTQAQRDEVSWPRSHSCLVKNIQLEPRSLDSKFLGFSVAPYCPITMLLCWIKEQIPM